MKKTKVTVGGIKLLENSNPDKWELVGEGYFTTKDLDRGNDISEPTAFTNTMPEFMKNPILLTNHNYDNIVGQVLDYTIDKKGVKVKFGITKATGFARDTAALVRAGILKAFSFSYRIVDWVMGKNGEPNILKELEVFEISLVAVPMNPTALVTAAKANNIELESNEWLDEPDTKGIQIMDGKLIALEKQLTDHVGFITPIVDEAKSRMDKLDEALKSMQVLQKAAVEKADQLEKGQITAAEFLTFKDSVTGDLKELTETVQKAQAARQTLTQEKKIIFKDFQSYSKDTSVFLRDESGMPLPELQQKAYRLFNAPIDYEKSPDGGFMKAIRDCYDAVLCSFTLMKQKNARLNVQSLKNYKLLHDMVEFIDPEFAKAMYSTGTGVGDEWVPTLMSSQMEDLFHLEYGLAAKFPRFNMPSNPYTWPIKSSGATAYIASEAATDNPSVLKKSNIGTSNITFTADTHAVCVSASPELVEDAIVEMMGIIRAETAKALAKGEENALINGDTTSTHRDTAVVTGTDDIARAYMGLRFLAVDLSNTFDTQSTTDGDGDATADFKAGDIRGCRKLLGPLGVKPQECLYVTSISVLFYTLSMSEFTKANEYGGASTWYTGELPVVDGCEMYVSGELSETLGTAGLGDSASSHKAILCVHKPSIKIGDRRGVTLEFEKNITTQQYNFVATRRTDMQNMQPSTLSPVSYGYNID